MENEKEEAWWEPEECQACGMEAGDFSEEDFHDGVWYCPDCGEPQQI